MAFAVGVVTGTVPARAAANKAPAAAVMSSNPVAGSRFL
jgi:hypothetical protein